ncbi:MFS transporter [Sphingomonas sp.]|uniref:MFS transporter n=1 Tax=Sphingomonas sp. TaxID=28214 RepID=UPI000DB8B5FA|nr:MFS transporter [Sphingomonas sp.]PZU06394.1 MAG: MFS transporter [Sphingomonas sp.]
MRATQILQMTTSHEISVADREQEAKGSLTAPLAVPVGIARRWSLIAILSLTVLLSYADRLVINLVAGGIQNELALSELAISLVMGTGFALLYALFGIPLGRLADRLNRRNLVMAGIAVWSTATAACAIATSFGALFVARMFVGLGEAALMPAATSLITDTFSPQERGRAFGVFHVGGVLGSGLALGLGGLILASVEHGLLMGLPVLGTLPAWRNVLLIAALPGAPLCLLLLTVNEPQRQGLRGAQGLMALVRASLARRARVARACLAVGVVAAGDYGLLSWLPSMLDQAHGIEASVGGQLIGAMVAGGGLGGCFLGGWLTDYCARKKGLPARIWSMRISYAICLASVVILILPNPTMALCGAGLWVFGSVSGIVAANTYLPESVANEHRATVMAFSNICSAIVGMGLGPTSVVSLSWLMPQAADHGLRLGIAGVCGIAASVALLLLAWRSRPLPARNGTR